MANTNINPFGQGGELPAGYPISTSLDENNAQKAAAASTVYQLKRMIGSAGGHWNGKKWYGFGTSITNTSSEGKYATYLAALSGMTFVNCGHSGGGITAGSNETVYDDIMSRDLSDADLITLEVGANEGVSPLGSIYDGLPDETVLNGRNHDDVVNYTGVTDNSTFCGALNLILRHLLSTTNAQIVVFQSPNARYISYASGPSAGQTKYYDGNEKSTSGYTNVECEKAIEDICKLNSVHFIPSYNGLGYARLNASNAFNVDNIHQSNLGGYNFAQAIWSQLKNIPLFYTAVPT